MVEKPINIIINELTKHNIEKSCLLASYIFNQSFPSSQKVKRVLISGIMYCLHEWIKNNNKVYDIGYMQFMRNYDEAKYLPPSQLSIKKPNHLKKFDDYYEEFYSQLQNFDKETYYNNAIHHVKKCIKASKRKHAKN